MRVVLVLLSLSALLPAVVTTRSPRMLAERTGRMNGQPTSSGAAVERTIVVDGHPMRARVGGVDRRGAGPTVIFEGGAAQRLETWSSVFEDVARLAPVVAYDRPGNGASAADGQLATPTHVARKLHALLSQLGVKPPYVLVGHSWGGPLIRMFAGLYPKEVVGLVFVDPTDLRSEDEDRAYLRGQGYSPEQALKHRGDMWARMSGYGGELRAIAEVSRGYVKEVRDLPPLPDIPVTVLLSDRFEPSPWANSPCAPRDCHDFALRFRIERLIAMTRSVTHGTLTIATGRGHEIHVDDPPLVVSAIQQVLSRHVSGASRPSAR